MVDRYRVLSCIGYWGHPVLIICAPSAVSRPVCRHCHETTFSTSKRLTLSMSSGWNTDDWNTLLSTRKELEVRFLVTLIPINPDALESRHKVHARICLESHIAESHLSATQRTLDRLARCFLLGHFATAPNQSPFQPTRSPGTGCILCCWDQSRLRFIGQKFPTDNRMNPSTVNCQK